MSKMRRRQKVRKHVGSFIILSIVLLLFVFVSVGSLSLRAENAEREVYISELEKMIGEEEDIAEKLKEYKIYIKTKKFVEETAKEFLGLVNENEIIFKAED